MVSGITIQRAAVTRLKAELTNAKREVTRYRELRRKRVSSESEWQARELARDVAAASLARAQAEFELSVVRAPIDGQVLEVHVREGQRVAANGIMELGETAAMYAIAEVYETDIGRVRVGQAALIRSPALPCELCCAQEVRARRGEEDEDRGSTRGKLVECVPDRRGRRIQMRQQPVSRPMRSRK